MAQEAEEIIFPAKKMRGLAIVAVLFGVIALWILRQSNGLTPFRAGFVILLAAAVCWAVWAGARRRLVFAGKILRVMAGSKTIEEVDLSTVSRLILRRRRIGRIYDVSYFAVLPGREAELFAKQNYRDLSRILQLLEERTGRKIEEERT
jgi:hypothetical protein